MFIFVLNNRYIKEYSFYFFFKLGKFTYEKSIKKICACSVLPNKNSLCHLCSKTTVTAILSPPFYLL